MAKAKKDVDPNAVISSIVTHFPDSRCLASAAYNPKTKTLLISFRDGGNYVYMKVPKRVFKELSNADSAGGYYTQEIKGQFETLTAI